MNPLENITLKTATCEAKHLPTIGRLSYLIGIEGIEFNVPLVVEHAHITEFDEIQYVNITVWHNNGWMMDINVMADDVITFQYRGDPLDLPTPPDRTNMIRVHGSWKPAN